MPKKEPKWGTDAPLPAPKFKKVDQPIKEFSVEKASVSVVDTPTPQFHVNCKSSLVKKADLALKDLYESGGKLTPKQQGAFIGADYGKLEGTVLFSYIYGGNPGLPAIEADTGKQKAIDKFKKAYIAPNFTTIDSVPMLKIENVPPEKLKELQEWTKKGFAEAMKKAMINAVISKVGLDPNDYEDHDGMTDEERVAFHEQERALWQ